MDRRHVLDLLGSGLLLSAAPSMVSGQTAPSGNAGGAKAALLVPLSGASAELGLSMQRATRLAQSGGFEKEAFPTFDTSDTPEAAGTAAAKAVAQGAAMILGPLFARQMQAVGAAANGVPVISFSNSAALTGSGIFTFGITPSQSVSAILQYARGRGVRRVATIGTTDAWSEQSKRAAQRLAPEIGVEIVDVALVSPGMDPLQALRTAGIPDAALLTGGHAQFAALAPGLQANGVQVLGTMQALGAAAASPGLEGVWLSAPDPAAFATFAEGYSRSGWAAPGAIASLAYDAARIAETLRSAGKLNREGLLAADGFPGVAGAVRFRADGRCVRELAILVVNSGTVRAVARKAGL